MAEKADRTRPQNSSLFHRPVPMATVHRVDSRYWGGNGSISAVVKDVTHGDGSLRLEQIPVDLGGLPQGQEGEVMLYLRRLRVNQLGGRPQHHLVVICSVTDDDGVRCWEVLDRLSFPALSSGVTNDTQSCALGALEDKEKRTNIIARILELESSNTTTSENAVTSILTNNTREPGAAAPRPQSSSHPPQQSSKSMTVRFEQGPCGRTTFTAKGDASLLREIGFPFGPNTHGRNRQAGGRRSNVTRAQNKAQKNKKAKGGEHAVLPDCFPRPCRACLHLFVHYFLSSSWFDMPFCFLALCLVP